MQDEKALNQQATSDVKPGASLSHVISKVQVNAVGPTYPGSHSSEMSSISGVFEDAEKRDSENTRFAQASPLIDLRIMIDNPRAQGFLKQGKQYYMILVPAEAYDAQAAATVGVEAADVARAATATAVEE